jgi:hypothetical protein
VVGALLQGRDAAAGGLEGICKSCATAWAQAIANNSAVANLLAAIGTRSTIVFSCANDPKASIARADEGGCKIVQDIRAYPAVT